MHWAVKRGCGLAVLLLAAVIVLSKADSAEAQHPYAAGYWGGSLGWPRYVRDHIPYFAAHPPVYYSYPVARAYGFSPYAYPPGTPTPELQPLRPAVFENPFVGSVPREAPKPQVIENPHVP